MLPLQNAAVIGHPIGHTMSPFLQKRLFALQQIPMRYQVLDLPQLEPGLEQLRALDCFNITIPHKTAIIPFLDGIDEKARACGSVNTVRVEKGKLYGTTTDGAGCFRSLQRHGLDFSGNVLLLGNGGAARAIAFEIASRQEKLHLTIACRESSYEKAQALGKELAVFYTGQGKRGFRIVVEKYDELEGDADGRFDLLINATSVGMYPHAGTSPVSEDVISRCGAVFDAIYNPEKTRLLQLADKLGKKAVGGMEMLVYQAVAAHEFWYGSTFREEDLSALCRDANREMRAAFAKEGAEG